MLVAKRELDNYYHEVYQEEIDIIKEKEERKRSKKKKKVKAFYKIFAISLALIGTVLCVYILYGYANITKIKVEISELERQKYELTRDKEDLIAELEAIKCSSNIQENAMIKLGMDYPTEEQVVYLSIDELDIASETEVIDETSLTKKLKDGYNLVLGFFKGD